MDSIDSTGILNDTTKDAVAFACHYVQTRDSPGAELKTAIGRVVVVDKKYEILLDVFVRPSAKVANCGKKYTGISLQKLEDEGKDPEVARQLFADAVKDKHVVRDLSSVDPDGVLEALSGQEVPEMCADTHLLREAKLNDREYQFCELATLVWRLFREPLKMGHFSTCIQMARMTMQLYWKRYYDQYPPLPSLPASPTGSSGQENDAPVLNGPSLQSRPKRQRKPKNLKFGDKSIEKGAGDVPAVVTKSYTKKSKPRSAPRDEDVQTEDEAEVVEGKVPKSYRQIMSHGIRVGRARQQTEDKLAVEMQVNAELVRDLFKKLSTSEKESKDLHRELERLSTRVTRLIEEQHRHKNASA